ncbi:NAD-dependent protein deacylase 1 [Pseudomonas reidholzensis]|uniref:NAD-dependent protein deacylase n=1 Tax=Pseudomonas reidholzensis TaxID=1785162 RepID=A0A383RWL8_9PSED|nr:NAD-dependent deacylase [Pseudomonas reidholzensis]SYX90788.1 NAD-dependent protein deacylase 1 [Pseudomonas reidholzensis]
MHFDPRLLADARHVVVFTGAGVSAESGIATFRDKLTGLWERFDPAQLASAEGFRRDPALIWGWYEMRRAGIADARPNPAHLAIAELATRVPQLTLITQNVDDLHERAGSHDVIHLHGRLDAARCLACARSVSSALALPEGARDGKRIEPPRCAECDGPLRPGVVWFGESLPEQALSRAFLAAAECDLLLSVGTSGVVQPAALIPGVALEAGARVVHINPQVSGSGHAREFAIAGKAGEVLPRLLSEAFA